MVVPAANALACRFANFWLAVFKAAAAAAFCAAATLASPAFGFDTAGAAFALALAFPFGSAGPAVTSKPLLANIFFAAAVAAGALSCAAVWGVRYFFSGELCHDTTSLWSRNVISTSCVVPLLLWIVGGGYLGAGRENTWIEDTEEAWSEQAERERGEREKRGGKMEPLTRKSGKG